MRKEKPTITQNKITCRLVFGSTAVRLAIQTNLWIFKCVFACLTKAPCSESRMENVPQTQKKKLTKSRNFYRISEQGDGEDLSPRATSVALWWDFRNWMANKLGDVTRTSGILHAKLGINSRICRDIWRFHWRHQLAIAPFAFKSEQNEEKC